MVKSNLLQDEMNTQTLPVIIRCIMDEENKFKGFWYMLKTNFVTVIKKLQWVILRGTTTYVALSLQQRRKKKEESRMGYKFERGGEG